MSGVITAAVVVAGGTAYAADKASDAADKAASTAAASAGTELDFAKAQYSDWQDTYGAIEDNLAQYYNSLSPEYYETQGLEAFEKEQQRSREQMETMFAQRGLTGSGLETRAFIDQDIAGAETRAGIRVNAPRAAAQEQSDFLRMGLGQNPAGTMQNVLGSQTQMARQDQMTAERGEGAAWQALPGAVAGSIQATADRGRYQPPVTEKTGITDYDYGKEY